MRFLLAAALLATAAHAQDAPPAVPAPPGVFEAVPATPGDRCTALAPMPTISGGDTAQLRSLRLGDGMEPAPMPNWCGGTTASIAVLPEGVRFPTQPIPFDAPDFDALSDDALVPFGRSRYLFRTPDVFIPPSVDVPNDYQGLLARPDLLDLRLSPAPVAPPADRP